MSLEKILEYTAEHWLNIGSIIFLLIIIPVRNWTRNKALEKIKTKLNEGEYIVYEPSTPIWVGDIFAPLLIGGIILQFILSSFIFPDYLNSLPLVIIIKLMLIIIGSFCLFYICCSKYVITNQRILTEFTFDFMYKFKKLFDFFEFGVLNLNIANIENIEIKGYHGFLVIKPIDSNKTYNLLFENTKKIKSIIEKQISLS